MNITWKIVNTLRCGWAVKSALFLCVRIVFYALMGGLLWFVFGRRLLSGTEWFICFAGYPALFVGYLFGVIYLYNHEFT